ncbi:uncharacterized protein LOC126906715 isoform X2 [Daktulosphaira vitifoliae]|uniref:uncharacterized protein LOC126906715 isoform X2 n=1 Tax=Daktulosphaira vitifoliae TaxID=58002 RepID=UPI0021AA5BD8|nr:uncharacterized protein LOC126906715 isoform X2 [Daktulosphaira vitifoliae]
MNSKIVVIFFLNLCVIPNFSESSSSRDNIMNPTNRESSKSSRIRKTQYFPDTNRTRKDIGHYQLRWEDEKESSSLDELIETPTYMETSRTKQNIIISSCPNLTPEYIEECKKINDGYKYYNSNFLIELLKKHSEVNNILHDNVLKQIYNETVVVFGLNDMYKYINLHIQEKSSSSTSSSTFSLSKLLSCSSSKNTID